MYTKHQPVLLAEVIDHLNLAADKNVVDCTLGGGGHSQAILEATRPNGKLLGIDADREALEHTRERLSEYDDRIKLAQGNFVDLADIASENKIGPVHGVLFDLGVSTHQIMRGERGFSFQQSGELDMRFNVEQEISALDILNDYSVQELTRIFNKYGEVRQARRIAAAIGKVRKEFPLQTTDELAEIVKKQTRDARQTTKEQAKVFQAIRIVVNSELEHLEKALSSALEILELKGRLTVISYHSLEDRIVKQFIRDESQDCQCPPDVFVCRCQQKARLKVITKKPITPSTEEIENNPRSRSAKLRVAEKII